MKPLLTKTNFVKRINYLKEKINHGKKITEEEMKTIKKAYLVMQEDVGKEAQNDEQTVLN